MRERRWAFSIWGIIFLLQGAGVVYQFLPHGYGVDGWQARIINTIGACHARQRAVLLRICACKRGQHAIGFHEHTSKKVQRACLMNTFRARDPLCVPFAALPAGSCCSAYG